MTQVNWRKHEFVHLFVFSFFFHWDFNIINASVESISERLNVCLLLFHEYLFGIAEKIVCYYGTWAAYRQGNGQFTVQNIDPNLCTHIVYTFFGIGTDGSVTILDPWLDLPDGGGRDNIHNLVALKQQNPKLKVMAAVGGWNEGSQKFSQVNLKIIQIIITNESIKMICYR